MKLNYLHYSTYDNPLEITIQLINEAVNPESIHGMLVVANDVSDLVMAKTAEHEKVFLQSRETGRNSDLIGHNPITSREYFWRS